MEKWKWNFFLTECREQKTLSSSCCEFSVSLSMKLYMKFHGGTSCSCKSFLCCFEYLFQFDFWKAFSFSLSLSSLFSPINFLLFFIVQLLFFLLLLWELLQQKQIWYRFKNSSEWCKKRLQMGNSARRNCFGTFLCCYDTICSTHHISYRW